MSVSLTSLLSPGVLGFFKSFEVVEVFATPRGQTPVNVLTVVVAEESEQGLAEEPEFLTKARIKVRSLGDWSFGVQRYRRPIGDLQAALDELVAHSEWRPSSSPSRTGRMIPLPHVFAPPDGSGEVPLNRVLKNNFWNGSHVLEWADLRKDLLRPLLEDPRRLRSLAEQVQAVVPVRLAEISDRLGHVIVQIPVTVLLAEFGQDNSAQANTVEIAWAKGATPRPLVAACRVEFDELLTGSGTTPIVDGKVTLPGAGRGELRGLVYDEENQLALAASAPVSFVRSIAFNMRVADPEPRTFSRRRPEGTVDHRRIDLTGRGSNSRVGEKHGDDIGGWTGKRIYQEEAKRLAIQRRFKSYRSTGNPGVDHEEALKDLRLLIGHYGEHGAWLWDPYLGADELIETLFYSPFSGVELRALTAGKDTERNGTDFVAAQKAALQTIQGNLRGLRLEFRVRNGQAGWPFHDRFLIFPISDGGALAWSLGTSVNSFGKEHHILQQVDNGQLVADAFQDLWDALGNPENLIWKTP